MSNSFEREWTEGNNIKKTEDSKQEMRAWLERVLKEAPERGSKKIIAEDNTYWEEGEVSLEVMNLIEKTPAVQAVFKELREKRGEMGERDVRHMIRVAELLRFVMDNDKIKFTAEDRRDLLVAALCHDEGKASEEVKAVLENKKGKELTEEERKIMQGHVRAGHEFLMANGETRVARIMLYHHENIGEEKSYPRKEERRKEDFSVEDEKRTGERREYDTDIKRLGDFLAIADKVEANGSKDRPYNAGREARGLLEAKKKELANFNSLEEILMIDILENMDPNNLRQRADAEIAEIVRENEANFSANYPPSETII